MNYFLFNLIPKTATRKRTPEAARKQRSAQRTPAARPGLVAASQHSRLVQAVHVGCAEIRRRPQRLCAGQLCSQTQLGRHRQPTLGRSQLEDHLVELARRPHPKCRTQQSRNAEPLVAQPSRPDGLHAMVHIAPELDANVAQRLAACIVFARRNTQLEHDVVGIGATWGPGERWCGQCVAQLVQTAVHGLEESGEVVAATNAVRKVRTSEVDGKNASKYVDLCRFGRMTCTGN